MDMVPDALGLAWEGERDRVPLCVAVGVSLGVQVFDIEYVLLHDRLLVPLTLGVKRLTLEESECEMVTVFVGL